jgi:nitroimidazol reductase NimA-like FMN-containing flavoprotein (pyridoxamine 5'-phosphate oxidase superfamily)
VIKVLSETEALQLIERGKVGRLGCIDQGEPYVVPLNYFLEDGALYSHSLPGKKITAMKANPRVCLQVDQMEDELHWSSAIAFGNFHEIHDAQERRNVLGKLLSSFSRLTPVESLIAQDAAAPDSIVFRIVIDRITGVEET